MSQYLEEAAALLRKAAEANEEQRGAKGRYPNAGLLIEGQERIAMKFAQLGAIEKGLVPQEMAGDLIDAAVRRAREESGEWSR